MKRKKAQKKLTLSTQTVRTLGSTEVAKARGGLYACLASDNGGDDLSIPTCVTTNARCNITGGS